NWSRCSACWRTFSWWRCWTLMAHTIKVEPLGLQATPRVDFMRRYAIVPATLSPERRGVAMTQRSRKQDPLLDIVRSQREEIKKYKWIESEKAGVDIGWERAVRE